MKTSHKPLRSCPRELSSAAETLARFDVPNVPKAFRTVLWEATFSNRGLSRLTLIANPAEAKPQSVSQGSSVDRKLKELKHALALRLNGGRADFDWTDFDLGGKGEFHRRVWQAMLRIPFGETATYAEVARDAGSPLAFRACGQACGANRILIFIPCHRVVSANGLGGFGYGLHWKKQFLAMERSHEGDPRAASAG